VSVWAMAISLIDQASPLQSSSPEPLTVALIAGFRYQVTATQVANGNGFPSPAETRARPGPIPELAAV